MGLIIMSSQYLQNPRGNEVMNIDIINMLFCIYTYKNLKFFGAFMPTIKYFCVKLCNVGDHIGTRITSEKGFQYKKLLL